MAAGQQAENLLDFDDDVAGEQQPSGLAATTVLASTPAAANLLAGTSSNPLDDLVSIFGGANLSPAPAQAPNPMAAFGFGGMSAAASMTPTVLQAATPAIPQLGGPPTGPQRGPQNQQPAGPPPGQGLASPTRRVGPGDLPQVRTVRQNAGAGNIRRIPNPGQMTPPSGQPQIRPMSAPQQRPATGSIRPTTGSQQRPATGPMQRPSTGPMQRPATGARPVQPPRQGSHPSPQQAQGTNWQPVLWAVIGVVAVILLIILFTNI